MEQKSKVLSEQSTEGALFSNTAISKHLRERNYPESALWNFLNCGGIARYKGSILRIMATCQCQTRVFDATYRCNLRTCPVCSRTRKKRLRRRFLPYLKSLPYERGKHQVYFLTISPRNYPSFKKGLAHIKKSFKKFLRTKYIRERIKGGLYVIETKHTLDKGWNIHIHAIIYGRRLDNSIRGKCLECGQNLIKFDYGSKKFYCANRKCNSTEVVHRGDSRIVGLFKRASGSDCNIRVSRLGGASFTLNYMLKYISANKDEFGSADAVADYMVNTRKQRLVNAFGSFFRLKLPDSPLICPICNTPIAFELDVEVSRIMSEVHDPGPPTLGDF
jgi:hypothetical protein